MVVEVPSLGLEEYTSRPEGEMSGFKVVGEGLVSQAIGEWSAVSTMFDPDIKNHTDDIINFLKVARPVYYYNYLTTQFAPEQRDEIRNLSDEEAVHKYNRLVDEYNTILDGLTEENFTDQSAKIISILKDVFSLFGENWSPGTNSNHDLIKPLPDEN